MASAMADAGLPAYKLIFNAGTQLHGATAPFIFARNEGASKSALTLVFAGCFVIDADLLSCSG
jgi:hypothetical protein